MKTFEIVGTGTANKGAELMCHVITEQLRGPGVSFAVNPAFGDFESRAKYGLRAMLRPRRRFRRSRVLLGLMPKRFRSLYGITSPTDVSGILDAAGFSYGDRWGPGPACAAASLAAEAQSKRIPYILLPQAFGPFKEAQTRTAATRLFQSATWIYARDQTSLDHVLELGTPEAKVSQCHDFTNLSVVAAPTTETEGPYSLIVPNVRMMDQVHDADGYVKLLCRCAKKLYEIGWKPHLLIHETDQDVAVADAVNAELEDALPVLKEKSPAALKWHLGNARLVVGSRFHAIIGALSQGVPTIATSWSHKYQELFSEYNIPECIVNCDDPERAEAVIREIALQSGDSMSTSLSARSESLKEQSRQMFSEVRNQLGILQ